MSKNNSGFLLGAIIGGTAAALTALLLAPKSGKETREELFGQFDGFKERANEYSDYAKQKSSAYSEYTMNKAQEFKENTLSNLKKQTDDLGTGFKETVTETDWEEKLDNLSESYDDIVMDVSDVVKEAVDTTKEAVEETLEDI